MFNFAGAVEYLPDLLRGALVSVELTVSVMALSLVFGLLIALAKLSRHRVLSVAANAYIEVIRGTPCLL